MQMPSMEENWKGMEISTSISSFGLCKEGRDLEEFYLFLP